MEWKKVSPEVCAVLEEALKPYDCEKKPMFGCPAYFVNRNMFAGVHQDHLFIRLPEGDKEEIFDAFVEATTFVPMEGRPMREYVVLPAAIYSHAEILKQWLDRSYRYVSALPPKEPKATSKIKKQRS